MKSLSIFIAMKEEAYGKALAEGLAERNHGLRLQLWSKECSGDMLQADLILTDMSSEERKAALMPSVDQRKLFYIGEEFDGLTNLERELLSRIWESRDEGETAFRAKGKRLPLICGFYSKYGGSGVTATAIMAGRQSASIYGRKVLFLPMTGDDDSIYYSEADLEKVRSKKELLYRIKEGRPYHIAGYTAKDRWGLTYLIGGAGEDVELARHLAAQWDFDLIILDTGKRHIPELEDLCSICFLVVNEMDCRSSIGIDGANSKAQFIIKNHSSKNDKYAETIEIIQDEESFERIEKNIAISSSKSFAAGVKAVTEILEEAMEQTRE